MQPTPANRSDVVVIGGGIVGASTALALSQRDLRVTLCEKGRIAGEQSSRNWGWCRSMGRDSREVPLILESLQYWRKLEQTVQAKVGFRACGILYLCETQAAMESYEPWLRTAKQHGIDSRLITADAVSELLPRLRHRVAGALYTPTDARAEPTLATEAIVRAFRRLGGTVLTECAVRTVEKQAGRVSGVITEEGALACEAVVLAGGAWSRLFCGNLGLNLPQLKVLGSVLRTKPIQAGPDICVAGSQFAFRRCIDGSYCVASSGKTTAQVTPDSLRLFRSFLPVLRKERRNIRLRVGRPFLEELLQPRRWEADTETPFEQARVLDPRPDDNQLDQALIALREADPSFVAAVEAKRWAGLIDVTPDAVPVISSVDALPGFYIATGFSGHGFGLGPGAGHLMADLVTGAVPEVDPSPFRFSRFSDGSRTVLD